jgi:hypothetical protein
VRIILVLIAFGAIVCGERVVALLNEGSPKSARDKIEDDLARHGRVKSADGTYMITAEKVDKCRLIHALLLRYDADGTPQSATWAREAELLVDEPHGRLWFQVKHASMATMDGTSHAFVEERVLSLPLPAVHGESDKEKDGKEN